jgi:hypothetical protein
MLAPSRRPHTPAAGSRRLHEKLTRRAQKDHHHRNPVLDDPGPVGKMGTGPKPRRTPRSSGVRRGSVGVSFRFAVSHDRSLTPDPAAEESEESPSASAGSKAGLPQQPARGNLGRETAVSRIIDVFELDRHLDRGPQRVVDRRSLQRRVDVGCRRRLGQRRRSGASLRRADPHRGDPGWGRHHVDLGGWRAVGSRRRLVAHAMAPDPQSDLTRRRYVQAQPHRPGPGAADAQRVVGPEHGILEPPGSGNGHGVQRKQPA